MLKNLSKYSDSELFAALREKKSIAEAAFSEIYARYSQRVFAYCLRIIGNNEDAQDIFQDTFLNFFKSAQEHSQIANVSAYLLKIARNLCLNHKRNKKYNLNFDNFHFTTNDNGYEQKEMLEIIGTALECLDFEYKEAFVLRLYHGLSYQEISDITGESLSTIKNRVWRAKLKIKNILSPYLQDLSIK